MDWFVLDLWKDFSELNFIHCWSFEKMIVDKVIEERMIWDLGALYDVTSHMVGCTRSWPYQNAYAKIRIYVDFSTDPWNWKLTWIQSRCQAPRLRKVKNKTWISLKRVHSGWAFKNNLYVWINTMVEDEHNPFLSK